MVAILASALNSMRKLFQYVIIWVFIFLPGLILGQNENDINRYLVSDFSGTARVASMAGAFGSLGGDLSTPLINPAGSAIYRKSEIELTPGMAFNQTSNAVRGQAFDESNARFVFSNLGYVGSGASRAQGSTYFNFAMGFFNTKNFNYNTQTTLIDEQGSMLFDFVASSNDIFVDDLPVESPFYGHLAWETFIMDLDTSSDDQYLTQPRYENDFKGVGLAHQVEEKGNMNEVYVNGSVSIQENLFIGATIGINLGRFEQNTVYTETTIPDSLLLSEFTFSYRQISDISGVNVKLGLIYKPEDWLRLALAYHVPHQLELSDTWSTSVRSEFKDATSYSAASPEGTVTYRLRNPGKVVASLAFVSGLNGLISLDLEWMNYQKAKITSTEFDYSVENEVISQTMRNALTLRLGGELWLGRYSIRAGYAYRQNQFKPSNYEVPDFFNTYAIGAGLLTDNQVFINFSCSYRDGYRVQSAYNPTRAPIEEVNTGIIEILISAGVRF